MAANKTQKQSRAHRLTAGKIYRTAASQTDLQISSSAEIKPDYRRTPFVLPAVFMVLQSVVYFPMCTLTSC